MSRLRSDVSDEIFTPGTDLVFSVFAVIIVGFIFAVSTGERLRSSLKGSEATVEKLKGGIASLEQLREELRKNQALLAEHEKALALGRVSEAKAIAEAARLTTTVSTAQAQIIELQTTKTRLAEMTERANTLDRLAKSREINIERLEKENIRLAQSLTDEKAVLDEMRAEVAKLRKRASELQSKELQLAQLLQRFADLERTSKKQILQLTKQTAALEGDVLQARLEVERRFAGIPLGGENVVFIVDISGSMKMSDENTTSAEKWPKVCERFGQLMNSLTTLKKYQVVLFSNEAKLLHPETAGTWIDFVPKTSTAKTVAGLRRIDPEGGTNLYDGFRQAFRFNDKGLDTIYLFSDGLPTVGLNDDRFATETHAQKSQRLTLQLRSQLKKGWNRNDLSGRRVRINTVGFYYETFEVGAFLWQLAREHDGGFAGMSEP